MVADTVVRSGGGMTIPVILAMAFAGIFSVGCGGTGEARVASPAVAPGTGPDATYWFYVLAESADRMHRIRFGPEGASVEKTTPVGYMPVTMDQPHGVQISKDGRWLYLTTGHGAPDGKFWKYELGPDTVVAGPIDLGNFPASLDVTPDGLYGLVVNFNLHGRMVPSSVSVVFLPTFQEVAQTVTCTMPHGSRVSADGLHHYSVCMMDDQLVEISTRDFQVSRRFSVAKGAEGPITTVAAGGDGGMHGAGAMHGEGMHGAGHQGMAGGGAHAGDGAAGALPGMGDHPPASCSPTWAQPSPSVDRIYVVCNAGDEILEIDLEEWKLLRRFPTGRGPYNVEVSPDGRLLVVTLKQGDGVEFFDLAAGERLAQMRSSTTVTHGVVVTPDSRYAFVSVEGVGGEPGKVDIYDLRTFERVAEVEVRQQAAGIAFWRMEPAP